MRTNILSLLGQQSSLNFSSKFQVPVQLSSEAIFKRRQTEKSSASKPKDKKWQKLRKIEEEKGKKEWKKCYK
jgi:hypothetical protein